MIRELTDIMKAQGFTTIVVKVEADATSAHVTIDAQRPGKVKRGRKPQAAPLLERGVEMPRNRAAQRAREAGL